MAPLRSSDVFRSEVITAPELISDGYGVNSIYLSSVVSTTSSGVITVSLPSYDVGLINGFDYQVDSGDIVWIYGTLPSGIADGYYHIDQVLTDTTFTVIESINNSTDGYVQFRFPAGATIVGINPTGMIDVQGNTVQEAITELDTNKLNSFEHETLRQLIHFIDEGPGDGFASGAYKEILPTASIFPTSIIWYTDNTKSKKIVENDIIWAGIVPSTITWKVYNTDGVTVSHTVSDSISYANIIFETTRTRTIT